MSRIVKSERTGWRDEAISARHREWGWDCPAVDIDFLLLEYDKGIPIAIIEYKNERAAPQSPGHPSYRALSTLGNRANIPFLEVRYTDDCSQYQVSPINPIARRHLPDIHYAMTEKEYVTFLYKLRNSQVPPDILATLSETQEF